VFCSAHSPKIREIAVADRYAGAVEEETINGRQKAAEKAIGRSELNGSSFRHLGLISLALCATES